MERESVKVGLLALNPYIATSVFAVERQIVKLALPSIAGYLRQEGFAAIRQYDFEVEPYLFARNNPGAFRFATLFTDEHTDAFLAAPRASAASEPGGVGEIRRTVRLLLDLLRVEEAHLFGLSLAAVAQRRDEFRVVANLALCLVRELKERFSECRTLVGGCPLEPPPHQVEEYRAMLARCRWLDFAAAGPGEAPTVNVLRHLTGVASFSESGQPVEVCGDGVLLHVNRVIRIREAQMAAPLTRARAQALPVEGPPADALSEVGEDEPSDGGWRYLEVQRPSICLAPHFEPRVVKARRVTGRELLGRYRYAADVVERLRPYHERGGAVLPMTFIDGCNSRCAFCAWSSTRIVARAPHEVVRTIADLHERHGVRYFHFLNTNINAYREYAEAFADALRTARLDILWSDSANLRHLDDALIEKLRESGLIRVATGLECPSDRLLRYIHKGLTVDVAVSRLRALHEAGIWTHVQFIAGMPTETDDDIRANTDFIDRTKEYTNAYSVSEFYLDFSSRMGVEPDRFGIRVRRGDHARLEEGAFDEVDGLPWEAKRQQIKRSAALMYEAIGRAKGDARYQAQHLHLELLFWLYDCLGPGRKKEIVTLFEARDQGSRSAAALAPGFQTAAAAGTGSEPQAVAARRRGEWLVGFLQGQRPRWRSGPYRIAELIQYEDAPLSVSLGGVGGEDVVVLVGSSDKTPKYYARVGPFAFTVHRDTAVDSCEKERAVAQFVQLVRRGLLARAGSGPRHGAAAPPRAPSRPDGSESE
jgi:radical SAM superfamily enzyme YgiQ (UPF0313 family)